RRGGRIGVVATGGEPGDDRPARGGEAAGGPGWVGGAAARHRGSSWVVGGQRGRWTNTVRTPPCRRLSACSTTTSLLTPCPTRGGRSAPSSGHLTPVTVTPDAGPWVASSDTTASASTSRVSLPGPWSTWNRWSPHQPSISGTLVSDGWPS